jgi:hypothetical protein
MLLQPNLITPNLVSKFLEIFLDYVVKILNFITFIVSSNEY